MNLDEIEHWSDSDQIECMNRAPHPHIQCGTWFPVSARRKAGQLRLQTSVDYVHLTKLRDVKRGDNLTFAALQLDNGLTAEDGWLTGPAPNGNPEVDQTKWRDGKWPFKLVLQTRYADILPLFAGSDVRKGVSS